METPDAKRVLIVDDDPDAAALLKMLVEAIRQAADVRVARDGLAALSTACQWRPHIVLTDIDMPLLSGIEAALEMRTRLVQHPPRIVAMTEHAGWCTDAMALAVFDRVLIKPLDLSILRSVV